MKYAFEAFPITQLPINNSLKTYSTLWFIIAMMRSV